MEPAEFPAGGVKRSLLIFASVIEKRPAVLNHPAQDQIRGLLSQRRVVVEFPNELTTERPHVVDVFLNGLRRQVRRCQMFEERTKQGNQLLAGRQIFSSPIHERGQPFRSRQ